MCGVDRMYRLARCLGGQQQILAAMAIIGSICASAGAQINVNETGLHDGESVYGFHAPPTPIPYVNLEAITLFALGETDPTLYANVSFYAYGLYSDASLINSGVIDVNAIGGNATTNSGLASANIPGVLGIHAGGDANNTGTITIAATAGTADSSSEGAYASVGETAGIYAEGDIYNAGDITITATGGTANSAEDAFASAYAVGLDTERSANNTGALSITAIGGSAMADGHFATASTTAIAYGINSNGNIINTDAITATAAGGMATARRPSDDPTATAYADTWAEAYGFLAQSNVSNSGSIIATATGGTATASTGGNAYTRAKGIFAAMSVTNSGSIMAIATGGTADTNDAADAHSAAFGIDSRTVNNSGALIVTATGGTANAADANAVAEIHGIFAAGDVSNSGAVSVAATGGTADATSDVHADAQGRAYGLYSATGLIANSGQIDVAATGGTASSESIGALNLTSATGLAYGLYIADGQIDNTGKVTVTARGGLASADYYAEVKATAYGVFDDNGWLNNSGDITATALGGTAHTGTGIDAGADATGLSINGDVSNTGDLTIAATAGTAVTDDLGNTTSAFAQSQAEGIMAQGTVNNSGRIRAIAVGGVAEPNGTTPPDENSATAFASARGIFSSESVNNSGDILAAATGGIASADGGAGADTTAFGIEAYGTYGVLNNNSNVTVTATGGTAAGPYAHAGAEALGLRGDVVHNTGAITVVATGGTTTARWVADAHSSAWGISGGLPGVEVINAGAISVTATAGTVTGPDAHADAEAIGMDVSGNVYNSGAITVTATAGQGFASRAYGIQMMYGNLVNTGVIRATADTAYEVYAAHGTTTLVDTYNVTLDGDPTRASLAVADGATLALNNARLTVTAVSGETLWDTKYRLFETQGTGAVNGDFAGAQAVNPSTTVTYYDQGTAGSADDMVALAYTPVDSPTLASAEVQNQVISQAGDVINRHMTMTLLQNILYPPSSGLLAHAGSTAESLALAEAAPSRTSGVFVEPYYSRIDRDADPLGFEANLWGFSAGFERYIENTLLGLHLGYGQSDIDYTGRGYSGNSEDQDVVTGGISGLTRWDPWTLRYGVTGFYGRHDYEGLTGLALDERETASYDSYGTVTTLMGGHIFQWGSHVFLPEAGLDWLWTHRPRYTSKATDPSWDTTYSTTDDHDLYAAAALRWLSGFLWNDIHVAPSVSLGVRQLLTDDETSARLTIPGAAPVLVESEQDRTAVTLSGSLVLTKTPHAISLAYDGDYSANAQRHSIWLRYSWLF